jgi:amino acid transporter
MPEVKTSASGAARDGLAGVRNKVTLWPLVGAIYLIVAGGPFGLEDIVGSSGYTGAILILLITPLIWSLPTALMVSELSSAIPEDGGYYRWVARGMGRFWGFQEGWLSLTGSIFDMAIYPTLFVSYLSRIAPALVAGHRGTVIGVVMIAACAAWNMLGAGTVGRSSLAMTLLLLAPFAVLSVYAVTHAGGAAGHATAPLRHVDILAGLLIAMWNYMGWDNSTTIAGEVERPQKTYPWAMAIGVVLVALTYVLPIGAVAATGLDPNRWTTGGWPDVARAIMPTGLGGEFLGLTLTIAGMLGALGTLNALTLVYSRLPAVMAEDGFLPRGLVKRTRRTYAPWVSILVCATAWALCLGLNFSKLVMLDVLLTGLSILLEFAALVALRIREPDMERPYRVPGGFAGAVGIGLPPLALLALAVVRNDAEPVGPINALQLGCLIVLAGVICYFLARRAHRTGQAEPPAPHGI